VVLMAERVGFEPNVPVLPDHPISRSEAVMDRFGTSTAPHGCAGMLISSGKSPRGRGKGSCAHSR